MQGDLVASLPRQVIRGRVFDPISTRESRVTRVAILRSFGDLGGLKIEVSHLGDYDGSMKNFGEFLLEKGRVSRDQFARAKSQVETLNLKMGLCAYAFGFITEPQIQKIIGIQRRTGQRFGDIATALGFLSQVQLQTILRIQDKYRITIEDALVMDGAITQEQVEREQRLFQGIGRAM